MTIDHHSALRLSPRRSPRPALRRSSTTGSTTRLPRDEHSLILGHVVGITATRSNAFAHCESTSSIAYTAGAAVVVAKLTNNSQLEQRCFRAKPQPPPSNNTSSPIYESSTPSFTSHGLRNRTAQSLRDRGAGSQLYGSPLNDSFQSPGGKNIGTRAKTAACVALSPDGRLLAVGEVTTLSGELIGHRTNAVTDRTQATSVALLHAKACTTRCSAHNNIGAYLWCGARRLQPRLEIPCNFGRGKRWLLIRVERQFQKWRRNAAC